MTLEEQILQDIASASLPTGRTHSETELAARYGVSRTPIREAVRALEAKGVIERQRGRIVVAEPTSTEIIDFYDVRIVLEAEAAKHAATRRTELDLVLIRAAHQAMAEVKGPDWELLANLNQRFHVAVAAASHSTILIDFLEKLDLRLSRFTSFSMAHPGRASSAISQHGELLDAIDQRDATKASDVAYRHFSDARAIRLSQYADEYRRDSARPLPDSSSHVL